MKTKSIETIFNPAPAHFVGDGFRVHNFIPGKMSMQRMDPFIMLDYNSKFTFPPSNTPKGVGVHPHKGFETVTIAYKGRVEHGDSSGGGGVIGEGDVQWMTAASGILHKEFHETEWSKTGGEFQMVQLWVNLPAKDKLSNPKYQAITKNDITIVPLENNAGTVEVIAGTYQNVQGPASTFTPVHMMNAKLNKDGEASFEFPSNYNTLLLIVEGSVKVNNEKATTNQLVLFKNEGEEFKIKATEDALVLVLSGQPINEPIAAYGPFVMNTEQELIEAFNDFNAGKFGDLA
ncbi:pirin family protein [Flavobacterium sp. xlx-214]|uniref:pirin family protein n=1 Tax=unclassified Flavobacterium TaxID=196869 RepID=UPI0013D2E82A|nr:MULTISPECIES: pirin family protein [unclassified Flavobacterium]MBA5793124.1 pirin family protein [Flavobacterium sp. xlx-221]QMI82589.1 pirin family protein [Flavobacterium sp. xlx-214]